MIRLVDRLRALPPWRVDAVLATCFVLAALITNPPASGYRTRDAVAVVMILGATVPYFARSRAPLPVFAVSTVAAAALVARGYASGAIPMAIAVGAYTIGANRPLRELVAAAALLDAALVVMLLADNPGFHLGEFVTSFAAFAATMLAGRTMQSRRLRIEALEREHAEAARRAALDERLRIAQELHDVVAHSLGVIAVQSGVGLHLLDTDPDQARRALEHISGASRSSLAEIRRTLGLVRSGAVTHAPAPGLDDLDRLVQEVTQAGLPVTVNLADEARHLPAGIELAAYRIVQEALTNSLRHAGATSADVRLDVTDNALRIRVFDDGVARPGDQKPGGHGLVGMRERVAVYGGSVEAAPAPGGGFCVSATIPCDDVRLP